MSASLHLQGTPHAMTPAYVAAPDPGALLGPGTLAVFGFGDAAPRAQADPRYLHVGLQPRHAPAPFEVWRTPGPVATWRDGAIAGADGEALSFGWIECEEGADGIAAAAERAYREITRHLAARDKPHLLRMWNYLDAITEGDGDDERYRQFCVGRIKGLEGYPHAFPAGTAIGRRDGVRRLQVYWLAAREGGLPLENPRQVPAWEYPRQYGPRPPSFARAMLARAPLELALMLSGTASVVGHASAHPGNVPAQLAESFCNFDALLARARQSAPWLPERFGPGSLLKVYVRRDSDLDAVEALLDSLLDPGVPRLVLHAEVCRRELLVEIDGFHA